jgi:hypothetical protein
MSARNGNGKTAKKTAADTQTKFAPPSPRSGVRLPLGNHPGNTGGKPGRSGRKSQKLGLFLKELRESPDAQAALEAAALDHNNRNFGNAWKLAAMYDEEKPAEKRELSGKITVELAERLKRARERIRARR